MNSVLIIDDDKKLCALMKKCVEQENLSAVVAHGGLEGLRLLEENKDSCSLIVLDVMMSAMDVFQVLQKIREKHNVPVLMLTAKSDEEDKVSGLRLGADDYLTKPFNPLEIIARVKSNLRRFYELNPAGTTAPGSGTRLSVGGLELDPASFSLTKDGVPVTLTPMEYKIMACLMKAPGRIFTKVQLYEAANGAYFESDENTMMVHISKLRDKVENDPKNPRYIKTVRGLGYKIENTQ